MAVLSVVLFDSLLVRPMSPYLWLLCFILLGPSSSDFDFCVGFLCIFVLSQPGPTAVPDVAALAVSPWFSLSFSSPQVSVSLFLIVVLVLHPFDATVVCWIKRPSSSWPSWCHGACHRWPWTGTAYAQLVFGWMLLNVPNTFQWYFVVSRGGFQQNPENCARLLEERWDTSSQTKKALS